MWKITIVVPVYNVEKYLCQCVESIVTQSYQNIEVILVDDGSTDRSAQICDDYSKKDNRVKVIHQKNSGAAKARNAGIREATGDFICFVDSDDYWNNRDCLKEINLLLTEDPKTDVVMFDFIKFYESSGKLQENRVKLKRSMVKGKDKNKVLEYLVRTQLFKTSAVCKVVRRELLLSNGIFFKPGIVAEDIDWGLKLFSLSDRFDVCEDPFYVYRQRAGSVTKTINYKLVCDLWYVIKKWIIKAESGSYDEISKKSLLTYLAYHYSILMGMIGLVNDKNKFELINEMKQYRRVILQNSLGNKTKAVRIMVSVLGFDLSMQTLTRFLKLKKMFSF